jgi:hypothetical protein
VFLAYLILGKVFRAATYVPLITGFVAVAIAQLLIRSNRRRLVPASTTLGLVLGFAISEVIYFFAAVFLILNVLGS